MNIHVGPTFIQYLQLSQAQDELLSDNTHYSTHLWISTALIVARPALFLLFVFLEALYRSISWHHSSGHLHLLIAIHRILAKESREHSKVLGIYGDHFTS